MIVLVVAGVLIGMSVPAWKGFQRTLEQQQARAEVVQVIRTSRQMAVTRHASVILTFGSPPATTDITQYAVHVDLDNDRFKDFAEPWWQRSLPNGTRLAQVALVPTDSLLFDPSGALQPGGTGGSLIITSGRGAPDTLIVSSVGNVFRP
jgi:type II secretory pathway pseudopilin PulG